MPLCCAKGRVATLRRWNHCHRQDTHEQLPKRLLSAAYSSGYIKDGKQTI